MRHGSLIVLVPERSHVAVEALSQFSQRVELADCVLEKVALRCGSVSRRRAQDDELLSACPQRCGCDVDRMAASAIVIGDDLFSTEKSLRNDAQNGLKSDVASLRVEASTCRFNNHLIVNNFGDLAMDEMRLCLRQLARASQPILRDPKIVRLAGVVHGTNADCPRAQSPNNRRRESNDYFRRESLRPSAVDKQSKRNSRDDAGRDEHSIEKSFHQVFARSGGRGKQIYQLVGGSEVADAQ